MNPCAFRNCWSARTSSPIVPISKSRVNDEDDGVGADGVEGVEVEAPIPPEFTNARVFGPKYPTAGEMPFAAWNAASAARVRPPNIIVSFPGEPGPLSATIKPFAFKNCWSARASSPVEPTSRSRVNEDEDVEGVEGVPDVEADVPTPPAFMNARVFGPKYPTDGVMPFAAWNFASAVCVN